MILTIRGLSLSGTLEEGVVCGQQTTDGSICITYKITQLDHGRKL